MVFVSVSLDRVSLTVLDKTSNGLPIVSAKAALSASAVAALLGAVRPMVRVPVEVVVVTGAV